MHVALHVNVDHVATLRQARGTPYPDPVEAALLAERAGADGITVHLREDRRHIQPRDVRVLRQVVRGTMNLEIGATDEMMQIALDVRPDHVTFVPERREERTTEGGLDVVRHRLELAEKVKALHDVGVRVSFFIAPDDAQVAASHAIGAWQVELHTGEYAHRTNAARAQELVALARAAEHAHSLGLRVAAGHGLTVANVGPVAALAHVEELNIGHAIVSDAVMVGMPAAVRAMIEAMARGAAQRSGR